MSEDEIKLLRARRTAYVNLDADSLLLTSAQFRESSSRSICDASSYSEANVFAIRGTTNVCAFYDSLIDRAADSAQRDALRCLTRDYCKINHQSCLLGK